MMHVENQLCNIPLAWSVYCVAYSGHADLSEHPQLKITGIAAAKLSNYIPFSVPAWRLIPMSLCFSSFVPQ